MASWPGEKDIHYCCSAERIDTYPNQNTGTSFLEEEEKNPPCVSVQMKKQFKTENTACKKERGECVIFNGKNSCSDQIETRWERKNQKNKAEPYSGKRHQRKNVLPSQRTRNS